MPKLCLLIACLSLLIGSPTAIRGQETMDQAKMIPSSAMAAVFAKPKAILNAPSMELAPREIITVMGKKEFGFDPCEIRDAMVLLDAIQDPRQPPGFALVLSFDSDQAPGEKLTQYLEKGELGGKTIYRGGAGEPVIFQPDSRTIIIGMEAFIVKMNSARGAESQLISLVQENGGDSQLSAFVTIEPVRGLINENLPPANQIPMPFQGFRELPDLVDAVSLQLNFDQTNQGALEIIGTDGPATEKIEKIMRDGIKLGREFALSYMENEMRTEDPDLQGAIQQYGNRLGDFVEANFNPERTDRSLIFKIDGGDQVTSMAIIGTLTGMLLPAVQQVREAARRATAMNEMRQICLACLNYESAHRHFPQNIVDKDGKPLLSWRVQILPFMEGNRLYEQFHLDEPWDSEHNIKLLDQMPEFYQSPNAPPSNKTVYLGFEGPDTIFEGKQKVTFGTITDGSSNTILCVEANAEAAVEWSKPVDIPFDVNRDITEVGALRPGGFTAVLCDGSAHFIANSISQEMLKFLIQKSDGNIVDLNN